MLASHTLNFLLKIRRSDVTTTAAVYTMITHLKSEVRSLCVDGSNLKGSLDEPPDVTGVWLDTQVSFKERTLVLMTQWTLNGD